MSERCEFVKSSIFTKGIELLFQPLSALLFNNVSPRRAPCLPGRSINEGVLEVSHRVDVSNLFKVIDHCFRGPNLSRNVSRLFSIHTILLETSKNLSKHERTVLWSNRFNEKLSSLPYIASGLLR